MSDAAVRPAEPSFGVVPVELARTMSGLEFFRGWLSGRFPAPPIGQFMRGGLVQAEHGLAVFEGTPSPDHYNPLGTVHGGYAATLLDSCMGCAVHTTLAAGQGYTTLEIKVNYVRAMTGRTGPVRAEGRTIAVGSRVATAEGRLTDAAGKLLAHGTTTCLIFAR